MDEIPDLASAMLALIFAAVMLVSSQLFIEYRSNNISYKSAVTKGATVLFEYR